MTAQAAAEDRWWTVHVPRLNPYRNGLVVESGQTDNRIYGCNPTYVRAPDETGARRQALEGLRLSEEMGRRSR